MHVLDPNGSLHEYHVQKIRKANWRIVGFSVIAALVMAWFTWMALIAIAVYQNGK